MKFSVTPRHVTLNERDTTPVVPTAANAAPPTADATTCSAAKLALMVLDRMVSSWDAACPRTAQMPEERQSMLQRQAERMLTLDTVAAPLPAAMPMLLLEALMPLEDAEQLHCLATMVTLETVMAPLLAAMPMLLEALLEPLEEEDDMLHCMGAMVTL